MKPFASRWQYAAIIAAFLLLTITLTTPTHASGEHGHDDHSDEHGHEAAALGPHGGRLLTQGDVSVELLLTGHGGSPGYRAWVQRDGTPVVAPDITLTAALQRLDGEPQLVAFAREEQSWQSTDVVAEPHSFDITLTLSMGEADYEWNFSTYEGRVHIAAETAAQAGVESAIAGPGPIAQTLTVYGKTVLDPTRISHLRAQFPGVIVRLNATVGETVTAGQVLAEIESSDSLRRYQLQSPMAGVVVARDGNPGELAQQQALLTIANQELLWVEFLIFPGQAQDVAVGQSVRVFNENSTAQSHIQYVLPDTDGQPFLRARAPLDNTDRQWAPGLMLTGSVGIATTQVPLRVQHAAIQQIDGQDVVFIQSGDAYEARPVTVGLSDTRYTEIISGISPGARYVSNNSYLIKADIGKSGAAHNH